MFYLVFNWFFFLKLITAPAPWFETCVSTWIDTENKNEPCCSPPGAPDDSALNQTALPLSVPNSSAFIFPHRKYQQLNPRFLYQSSWGSRPCFTCLPLSSLWTGLCAVLRKNYFTELLTSCSIQTMLTLSDVLGLVLGREKHGQICGTQESILAVGGSRGSWEKQMWAECYLLCLGWSTFCTAGSNKRCVKYLKERPKGKWNVGVCCQHRMRWEQGFWGSWCQQPCPCWFVTAYCQEFGLHHCSCAAKTVRDSLRL